jgi:hypothetical protein
MLLNVWIYNIYRPSQSRLSTADYALSLVAPAATAVINRNFWKELIACVLSMLQGPHRKRHVQQFYC